MGCSISKHNKYLLVRNIYQRTSGIYNFLKKKSIKILILEKLIEPLIHSQEVIYCKKNLMSTMAIIRVWLLNRPRFITQDIFCAKINIFAIKIEYKIHYYSIHILNHFGNKEIQNMQEVFLERGIIIHFKHWLLYVCLLK